MKAKIQIGEKTLTVDLEIGHSLARPLDFDSQYSEFSAEPPSRAPLVAGSFVGDTRQGGSCNVERLELIPHCHGTHTETVGHIVDDVVTIASAPLPPWMICALLTVSPRPAADAGESYQPPPMSEDLLITSADLSDALQALRSAEGNLADVFQSAQARGLVVRCQVADTSAVESPAVPPYFSTEGIRWCNGGGVDHLLVNVPSIDRTDDGGRLSNHHLFWNVPDRTHALTATSWRHKTITELIHVAADIPDGFYLLNLQVPAFCVDAAPSQPLLFPLRGVA